MIRKTIRLQPEQSEQLEQIAQKTGQSLSALVRQALDAYFLECTRHIALTRHSEQSEESLKDFSLCSK